MFFVKFQPIRSILDRVPSIMDPELYCKSVIKMNLWFLMVGNSILCIQMHFFSLSFMVLCRVAKWLLESHVPKLGEDTNYDLNTATACHPNHRIIPFMALCIPFLALFDSCHAHITVTSSCPAMQSKMKNELTRKSGRQCLIWHIAQQLMVAQENCR